MKKIIIFLFIVIAIIATVAYVYLDYVAQYNQAQKENLRFEVHKDEEIEGTELTTLINRAMNLNIQNEIQKDENGKYINNGNNSINIDVKFTDKDVTYNMEKIYNSGMENFLANYRYIKFKCNEIQYHSTTRIIKYIQFEQIAE